MSQPDSLTLDQLRLFVSVADDGSFSACARRFKRAQSAVSYGIANLENNLSLKLFDRSGRKPALTPTGESLLSDARKILDSVNELRSKAIAIEEGLELEISMVVTAICPTHILITLGQAFQEKFPTVPLRIQTGIMEDVAAQVVDGTSQIGIIGPVGLNSTSLQKKFLTHISMFPVAASNHPLAKKSIPLTRVDILNQVQIVIAHKSQNESSSSANIMSRQIWRVADATTKLELIEAGLGWGYLPLDKVGAGFKNKTLSKLTLEEHGPEPMLAPLSCISNAAYPPGPATRWISAELQKICGSDSKKMKAPKQRA
jgi:DNA-binding transcriptional LysR family regulator